MLHHRWTVLAVVGLAMLAVKKRTEQIQIDEIHDSYNLFLFPTCNKNSIKDRKVEK